MEDKRRRLGGRRREEGRVERESGFAMVIGNRRVRRRKRMRFRRFQGFGFGVVKNVAMINLSLNQT